jgi:hypothetical protein
MDLAQLPGSTANAALTFMGIISPRRRLRAEIAADIELRDKLEPSSYGYQMLDARITRDIGWLTGFVLPAKQKETNWSSAIFGLLMLAGFGWWTVRHISEHSWWGFATGFGAFMGFAGLMGSRHDVPQPTDVPKTEVAGASAAQTSSG